MTSLVSPPSRGLLTHPTTPLQLFVSQLAGQSSKTSYHLTSGRTNAVRTNSGLEAPSSKQSAVSVPEVLFFARAHAKILYAQFAVHLPTQWRGKIFTRIDELLDIDGWDPIDTPLARDSFWTFLRFMTLENPRRLPALSMTSVGRITATWQGLKEQEIVNLEFHPDDQVRWYVTYNDEGDTEIASGICHVTRVSRVLRPFAAEEWFHNGPARAEGR